MVARAILLSPRGFAVLAVIATAAGGSLLARVLMRRLGSRMAGGGRRRAATITHSLLGTTVAAIWGFTVLIVMDQSGVHVGPLLAGAGIAGITLGFGAQKLVQDGLSGLFILLEDQFELGDAVTITIASGPLEGHVEAFSLRFTSLRAQDGSIYYIPNGNIQVISNRTRRKGGRR